MPVVIDGLTETRRMLRELGDEGPRELRRGLAAGAQAIQPLVSGAYPHRTGTLAGSVKVTRGNEPSIKVDPPEPYAGPVDFGGYPGNRPWIPDGRYLYPTVGQNEDVVIDAASEAISDLVRRI